MCNVPLPSDQKAQVYVLVLGNQLLRTATTPEVFLSGTVHGNERVGPTAVVEFASALLEMYSSSAWARRLVDTRTIVIVPAANSLGYDANVREENGIDPNRDFAWDQAASSCMATVAARTINELFRRHAFQLGLTFHAGDRSPPPPLAASCIADTLQGWRSSQACHW